MTQLPAALPDATPLLALPVPLWAALRARLDAIVVLRRRREGPAWTATTRVGAFGEGRITGAHVDALLPAHDLAA